MEPLNELIDLLSELKEPLNELLELPVFRNIESLVFDAETNIGGASEFCTHERVRSSRPPMEPMISPKVQKV